MLRLIDVALNILMAFIAVSRLRIEHIELPAGSDAEQQLVRNVHEMTLRVFRNSFQIDDNGRTFKLQTPEELETALVNFKNRSQQRGELLAINIESQRSIIMQELIDVLDLCHRYDIQQNLNYDSFD
jgi:biopolymer transport protein ExbD